MTMSKTSVRGFTILGAVLDECGWWATSDESTEHDEEVIAAIRGGMLAPIGAPHRRLFILSSPGTKRGYLWDAYQQDHGRPEAVRLVCHGPTWVWNPSVDPETLKKVEARDRHRYRREYGAEFVDSISAYLPSDHVDGATADRDAKPLAPRAGVAYFAAADFGLKRDSTSLAIGHYELQGQDPSKIVIDGLWCWTPSPGKPLVAERLISAISGICGNYHIRRAARGGPPGDGEPSAPSDLHLHAAGGAA
jgi:hypothetical protein